jgi:hypothetical protein
LRKIVLSFSTLGVHISTIPLPGMPAFPGKENTGAFLWENARKY